MRQVKTSSGKMITLNEQQEEGLRLINAWMLKPYDNKTFQDLFFCLEGYAGTGKTTISKDALDTYRAAEFLKPPGRLDAYFNPIKSDPKGKIAVTAPTHKAKKVISDAVGLEGKTIQSLIGLAPNVDVAMFDINNPEFSVLNEPGINKFSLIVLDEASMLNTDLFELLTQQAMGARAKILFMCDRAQLPPIGEEISPVLTSPIIGHRYQLTKVERQAGDNPLMLVYDAIRSNISSNKDVFEHKTNLIEVPRGEFVIPDGVHNSDLDRLQDEWLAKPLVKIGPEFLTELNTFGGRVVTAFNSDKFKDDPNYCKVLCWTNKQVKFWNDQIRKTLVTQAKKHLGWSEAEMQHAEVLMDGELLMGYTTTKGAVMNSSEYRVSNIQFELVNCQFGNFIDGDPSLGRENEVDFEVYKVRLTNEVEDFEVKIVAPNTQNYRNFLLPFNWYLSQGKFHKKWPMYFGWRNNYVLITDIKAADGKLIVKKDIDYAYALSTHKSQGSTYTQVFVDEKDIDQLENVNFVEFLFGQDRAAAVRARQVKAFDKLYPDFATYWKQKQIEKNKLKYVAFSRPTQKACIFTTKTT